MKEEHLKKMKVPVRLSAIVILLVQVYFSTPAQGQQIIKCCVPAVITESGLKPIGKLDPNIELHIAFGLPFRNQAELDSLTRAIYDPSSPDFHHYLTHEQFIAKFGPTESDYQAVIAFAKSQGMIVTRTNKDRILLSVKGTAACIEKAFHVHLLVYKRPDGTGAFFAPDRNPILDLKTQILSIKGLSNYAITRPVGAGPKPLKASLMPNYPNPFNPITTIRYKLNKMAMVRLTVYNVLGQQVAILVNGAQFEGQHQITFNGSGLTSGVYFYRLQAGDEVQVKKMLLMK